MAVAASVRVRTSADDMSQMAVPALAAALIGCFRKLIAQVQSHPLAVQVAGLLTEQRWSRAGHPICIKGGRSVRHILQIQSKK
jgi:hypothetical protein